jgi:hypothetical protein
MIFYSGARKGDGSDLLNWMHDNTLGSAIYVPPVEGYRSDTVTQVSRLYAACVTDSNDYLMTSDVDMIPLSDYWRPNPDDVTIYGHDLAGHHYPICYVGMKAEKWRQVMRLEGKDFNALIKRDLDSLPQAKNPDFYKYWFSDQDLITDRVNASGLPKKFINRGKQSNGFAMGRVDRGSWNIHLPKLIDCHMFHQVYFRNNSDKLNATMTLLGKVWPNEDFGWFQEYTRSYQKLTGHGD